MKTRLSFQSSITSEFVSYISLKKALGRSFETSSTIQQAPFSEFSKNLLVCAAQLQIIIRQNHHGRICGDAIQHIGIIEAVSQELSMQIQAPMGDFAFPHVLAFLFTLGLTE